MYLPPHVTCYTPRLLCSSNRTNNNKAQNHHDPLKQAYHFPHCSYLSLVRSILPLTHHVSRHPIAFSDQCHVRHTFMYVTPLQRYHEITFLLNMDAMITKFLQRRLHKISLVHCSFITVQNGAVIPTERLIHLQFFIKLLPSCVRIRTVRTTSNMMPEERDNFGASYT